MKFEKIARKQMNLLILLFCSIALYSNASALNARMLRYFIDL